MSKHYVGFPTVIVALGRNEITFEELDSPDAILCFDCDKDYLLGSYIPIEASWVQGCIPQFGEIDISKLTPEALILWNRFRLTVERANNQAETFHKTGIALEGFSPEDLYFKIGSSFERANQADSLQTAQK